jgi:hypothetical protein
MNDGIADPPLPFNGGRFPSSQAELALVKRRILVLYIICPALSFAALLGGFNLDWPGLMAAGAFGFGATGLVIGALAMRERRLMFIVRSYRGDMRRYVIYEGLAAVPLGFAYFVAGLTVLVLVLIYSQGTSLEAMRALLLARPGYALVPVGTFLTAHALGFVIGFNTREETAGQRVFNALLGLPVRLAGLAMLALGCAALAIGFIEWTHPEVFQAGFKSLFGNPWPFSAR